MDLKKRYKFFTRKARRCLQKAYDLNPGKDETGCALVDILVELEEEVSSRYKISSKNCLQI